MTKETYIALAMKAARMVLPTFLGAVGGVAATVAPAYFNAFCGG